MKPFRQKKQLMVLLSLLLLLPNMQVVHAEPEDPGTDVETPETPTTEEPEEPVVEEPVYIPSSNNRLASLTVNGQDLNPAFSPYVTEYSLTLSADTTKVTIDGSTESYYASVDGLGEYDVSYKKENYDFKITVTAESGLTQQYVIHLTISSDPVLFTEVDGVQLGFVLKDLDQLKAPEGFEMQEASFQGKTITVFSHDGFPFSLVYLQNDAKKADWYCYQDGTVTGIFRSLVINKSKYYYAGVNEDIKNQEGYTFATLNVVGEKIDGWKVDGEKNASKVMLYLYDANGNADYYVYDTDDQTMVNRREFEVNVSKTKRNFLLSPVMITIAIIVVIACAFLFIIAGANGKHSVKDMFNMVYRRLRGQKNVKPKMEPESTVELVRTSKVRIYAHPDELTAPVKDEGSTVEKPVLPQKEAKKPDTPKKEAAQVKPKEVEVKPDTTDKKKKTRHILKNKQLEKKNEKAVKEIPLEKPLDSKQSQNPVLVSKEPEAKPNNDSAEVLDAMTEIQKYIDQLFYLQDDERSKK